MSNRLSAEKSPYLLQHADNPVHWQPWDEAALAQARAEQKPIFLSIGYSTCHWCHVMAHESFENPAIAAALNENFISIKLDREERPDLDRVYMTYVQMTTGHGGWPMSVWLTPAGKPFFGGTYFPPEDRQGRPGFLTVLNAVSRHWKEQREKIITGANEIVATLLRPEAPETSAEGASEATLEPLHEAAGDAFEKCFQYLVDSHDAQWGGFGGAPKFPRASLITFLFRTAALQGVKSELGDTAVKLAAQTLQKMAEGGLHDQVGGGFHRYSVDEFWFVPHFEKMLYDQGQIAVNYLEAKQATGREVFAWIARGIFDYVQRDLTSATGGFYCAEDADSLVAAGSNHRAEGAFYVWTKAEIDAALAADSIPPPSALLPTSMTDESRPRSDSDFFCAHFGVQAGGNVESDPQDEFRGKNILRQRQSLVATARDFKLEIEPASEKLLAGLARLRAVRSARPRPQLDDKIITAWNGLMISAFAKGFQVLGEGGYLKAAVRAASFVEGELYDTTSGVLYRSWRKGRSAIGGFAEDYAYLIQGLLDLYEAGFEQRWLQWAVKLQRQMDALFWDDHASSGQAAGYFNSRADDPTVIVRLKEDYDGAEPAPNSVAVMNLIRFDWMLGLPGAREKALRTIEGLRLRWQRLPHALPQLLCAIELALSEPRTVVVAGDPQLPEFRVLTAVLDEELGPRRARLAVNGGPEQAWLATWRPYFSAMVARGGLPTAYVCENFTCQSPISDPEELRTALGKP